ncbi:glycosyltransferase [Paenisporosarcina sp. NPDC076898]|uniref:glycosyltransferase n=1 Tax=unclassified Paenisporosarcina TaxID=2642018 RepID=UPI003CFFECFA
MKNVLIYFPFTLAENPKSGSQLRPIEMLKAFSSFCSENGMELIVISGDSNKRALKWAELKVSGKLDSTEFCYAENQTIPLWLTDKGHKPAKPFIDSQIFKELTKKGIPIGLFYRDVYWKFDDLYSLKGLKKAIMQSIYRMEERFYSKYVHTIFLPSDSMGKYVDIQANKVSLPPGGREIKVESARKDDAKIGIYVGGINNEDYGLPALIESYRLLNHSGIPSNLKIVCRQDEYENLEVDLKKKLAKPYIEVLHINGEELNRYYSTVDFAFIPRKKSTYNDFSVPVKLVEYLSAKLPIVATNCDAQTEMINSGPYGVITEDNPESIARGIVTMQENHQTYSDMIEKHFLQNHSWEARAKQAAQALVGGYYESSNTGTK